MVSDPRSQLDELRLAAVGRAESLTASFNGIVEAAADVATDDEHDPEGHTIAWERQQVAGLLDETKTTLAAIDAALLRVERGEYGTCMSCDGQIQSERLEALPATAACVGCASGS